MNNCYKCENELEVGRNKPKSCPRCKVRLDYVFKEKVNNPKEEVTITEEAKKENPNDTYIPKEDS